MKFNNSIICFNFINSDYIIIINNEMRIIIIDWNSNN